MIMGESELCALLNGLRVSKRNGELDTDEKLAQQTSKWRDTLEYSVLVTCATHYSKECRLEMLALLVESKKSTLCFTRMELDVILLFLDYNLCEEMEYIPFVKKALKRLKSSLAVMQRQLSQELEMRKRYKERDIVSEMYEDDLAKSYQTSDQIEQGVNDYVAFFVNLRKLCVNNLYADATYARRRSSLEILLLMRDLLCDEFKDIEWNREQAKVIFHCLLLDTYESNKEKAYQLIKSMNPVLLSLDSESWVLLILKVSFELGNSVRPIDSVTAAYMLKISKLSPVIKNVLRDYRNVEDDVTEAITLQLILLLYSKLQKVLASAEGSVGMAISEHSLYGYLFCMRSLLLDCDLSTETNKLWKNTIADIIVLCFELNRTVSVVVNNSSPEGHLPMDLKTLSLDGASFPGKETVTPQMVLLCSWRTVKEVSRLFGLLVIEASIQTAESPNGLLTVEQIEHIMKHLVSLLCETKHRGAFEQAYVGFHQLCTRLWRLKDTTLNTLPMYWLHDILVGITGFSSGYTKLCATRRSAGVPFLIQAVLSSEPKIHNISETSASWVMMLLLHFMQIKCTINLQQIIMTKMYQHAICSKYKHLTEWMKNSNELHCKEMSEIDLIELKTHSMNILRALFRHSQLGDITKNYIADGLIVACRSYESIKWAERNAATLLFSALIIRIFGVQRTKDHVNLTTDNKMTARIFFEKYPNLFDFILHELQAIKEKDMIKSNVQVILLLLSRLYINYHFDVTEIAWIDKIVNLVSECAKSPVYKTRELAARALVPLLAESTAYNFVKKLFLFLCTARETKISTNLTHGYLLQIFEILTKLPSVRTQLLKSDVTNFLHATDWILKGLERRANEFSCFPLASVYIDILNNLDHKVMIESCDMENILHILQQHLVEKDLLRQEPGEQMYKVSVIKFILCVEKYSNFLQMVHNEQSVAFNIYSRLLVMPEVEIQIIAWTTISKVRKEQSYQQGKLLNIYAIHIVDDFAEDLYKYNPKLQDAIFDFLYNSLMDINECSIIDKREICNIVLKKIHLNHANNIYSQRANYLRLLGKCMTTLTHELKDKDLRMEYIKDIYRKVCDNSWIVGLLDKDFRLSVFDILYELFEKDIDIGHCHPVLDWWTMLLQLLVADNENVRHDASKLICKLEPSNELECIQKILSVFFQKFSKMVAYKYPKIAVSALFCWSVSLLGDTNYEMDETDVFDKHKDYEIFESVRISELCFNLTKSITHRYSINDTLPPDAVRWINYRLDTDFSTLSSFKEIICNYRNNPPVTRELEEILDPTYRDKLFQDLAYRKYMLL